MKHLKLFEDTPADFIATLPDRLIKIKEDGYVDFDEIESESDTHVEYEFTWKFLNSNSLSNIQKFIKKEKDLVCSLGTGENLIILSVKVPKKNYEVI